MKNGFGENEHSVIIFLFKKMKTNKKQLQNINVRIWPEKLLLKYFILLALNYHIMNYFGLAANDIFKISSVN